MFDDIKGMTSKGNDYGDLTIIVIGGFIVSWTQI